MLKFQHTAARRRLLGSHKDSRWAGKFQHTAARRRLHNALSFQWLSVLVSTHSRPKAAANKIVAPLSYMGSVSTHSRPKAAASCKRTRLIRRAKFQHTAARRRLRQWLHVSAIKLQFQHTAARRRLHFRQSSDRLSPRVSTHSRPKAAAKPTWSSSMSVRGFNTQPPEGGCENGAENGNSKKCFNTQPPEGGCLLMAVLIAVNSQFQHTAARRRLPISKPSERKIFLFQHTAARRRLPFAKCNCVGKLYGFNTQPPEGGCS